MWLAWIIFVISYNSIKLLTLGIFFLFLSNFLFSFAFFAFLTTIAYYLCNCIKLREVNLQKKESIAFNKTKEEEECLMKMECALGFEELKYAYRYLIVKWPQWERPISKIYHQRKEWFLENPQDQEQLLAQK